jgi:putative ABC transport system permease protein
MNIQFTLAYRYLSGRKLRTVLTTLAVVFGVLVLFGMNIILPSMLAALQANALAAAGQVDATITHASGEPFDAQLLEKAKAVDGVRAASASLNRTVNLPANFFDNNPVKADRITALSLVGVIPFDARTVRSYPTLEGRYLNDSDTDAALITSSLADALGVELGGTFPLPTANGIMNLTVIGVLPPRTMPGNEEILVTLTQAQMMADQPGKINAIDINLASNEAARRNEIVTNVEAALGKDYKVGTLLAGSEMYASLRLGQQMFNLLGVLALFMGGFIIFNTFRTVVVERRRDIGMLRALGAKRRTIIGLILIEGLIQGVVGTALGLVFGYLFGMSALHWATPVMSKFINIKMGEPVITTSIIWLSILMGVGVTVLAGLIPALNASRTTPLEALRPSVAEVEFKRQTGFGFVGGVVLIILSILALFSGRAEFIAPGGFVFLTGLVIVAPALVRPIAGMFGRIIALIYARSGTGDLAQGNLSRQPSRVAITASASMLGLAVVVAAGGMFTSLTVTLGDVMKKSLGSDYLFVPPAIAIWNSNLGSNAGFAERLRAVDGVSDVASLRYAGSAVSGGSVSLMGIEPISFQKVSGLRFQENIFNTDEEAYAALGHGRNLIVNGAFLNLTHNKVGDSVTLVTPKGEQSYRIVAMAADLLNAKVTTAFISQANMLADFDKAEDVFIQLNLKPGADTKVVEKNIKTIAADFPQYNVIDGKAYYNSMMSQMDSAFYALYILLVMLALPSLIAMINTLAIGVIERTREIGMIRAVGGTQKQLRRMVVAEALILAAIGTAFGLLSGLYLGYVFVLGMDTLFPMGYTFPASGVIAAIAIGLLFGVLAALIPARQAAGMNVVEALRYE